MIKQKKGRGALRGKRGGWRKHASHEPCACLKSKAPSYVHRDGEKALALALALPILAGALTEPVSINELNVPFSSLVTADGDSFFRASPP